MKNDSISRDAAIDIVKKNTFRLTFAEEQNGEGHVSWSAYAAYSDVIEGELLELPSAQSEWIPVTEALPRDDEDVIVTCLDDSGDTPYSYTTVAWHYKGMWVCDNMRCPFVIAWMPLPKPYAKRSKE